MRPVSPFPASRLAAPRRGLAVGRRNPAIYRTVDRGWDRLISGLARCRAAIAAWRLRRRYRRDLVRLMRISPRLIKDIGLSPEDVEQELTKPFWFP